MVYPKRLRAGSSRSQHGEVEYECSSCRLRIPLPINSQVGRPVVTASLLPRAQRGSRSFQEAAGESVVRPSGQLPRMSGPS